MKTFDAQCRVLESLEKEFKPNAPRKEDISPPDNLNTFSEYPRRWAAEPLRVRSSSRNPEGIARWHSGQYFARARGDNGVSNRTIYDRDNRTHAGWFDDDAQAYDNLAQPSPDFKLAPTDVGGFRKLFMEECLRHIERRMREFGEFRYQATLLEEEVRVPLRPLENTELLP